MKMNTVKFIELIKESVPKDFIKIVKRTRKFLYLTGNTYHSIPDNIQLLLWEWFKEKGVVVPPELPITNPTELGEIGSIIKTFPSFSTKRKNRTLFIYAFPKHETIGMWSPTVSSLNILLKENPQTVDSIVPYLNTLNYTVSPMNQWIKPFNLCTELYVSTSDWILVNSTEINEKILRQNLYKF